MQSPSIVPRAKLGSYVSPILESRRRPRSAKLRNDQAKQRSSFHEPPSFHVDEIGDWRQITSNDTKIGRFAQSTNALERFAIHNDNEQYHSSHIIHPETTMFQDNFTLCKSTLELSKHLSNSHDVDDVHVHDDDDDEHNVHDDNVHDDNVHDDDDDDVHDDFHDDDDDDVHDDFHDDDDDHHLNLTIVKGDNNDNNVVLGCDTNTDKKSGRNGGDDEDDCDDDDDDDDGDYDNNDDENINNNELINDNAKFLSKTPLDDEGVIDDDDRHHFGPIHKSYYSQIDSKSLTQSMNEADSLISSMLLGSSFTASSTGSSCPWKLRRGVGLFSSKYTTQTAVNASKSASLTFRNITGNGHSNHTNSSLMLVSGAYGFDEADERRNSLNGTGKSMLNGKSPVNRKRMMMSAKSHSNLVYSSSSGCSTQSSSASSQTSLSQHFSRLKTRSSLRGATQNFREFVSDYEQGLIDAICSAEQQKRPSPESVCEDNETNSDVYSRECTPDYNNDNDINTTIPNDNLQAPLELSKLNSSLRLQLQNVRSLRDKYETGCRTSEALERLMKLTKQKRECDKEFRENERLLGEIEQQLEAMIGTFRIRVEDLVGFARICPRDNYEIEFRHGKQRRVVRIRIGKTLERIFSNDVQEIEFQGALKPIIVCRLREVKSRWRKNVTLGETSISMSELLTAVACGRQILLDANASGTLKLRIMCTWLPKELKLGATLVDKENKDKSKSLIFNNVNEAFNMNTKQNSFSKIPRVFPKGNNFGGGNDLSKSMLTLPTQDSSKFNKNQESFDHLKRSKSTLSFEEHEDDDNDNDDDSMILSDVDDDDDDVDVDVICQSLSHEQVSVRVKVEQRITRIIVQLKNLEDSLEDYRGQFAEFTMMSLAVQKLLEYFGEDNVDSMFDTNNDNCDEIILDDVQNALAEFDFLEESESNSGIEKKIKNKTSKLNVIDEFIRRSKATDDEAIERCLLELDSWNLVLSIHLENALEQLSKIGAWILKSREREALTRIRVNTFAFENVYKQLRYPGKTNSMGKDVRVLELFSFAQRTLGIRWILTWSQLCQTLAEMIKEKLDLDQEWDDDSACYGSEWLCGKIVNYEQSKISLFDIRAFFELELWRSSNLANGRRFSSNTESLSLRKLFEIALDLDSLTRRLRKLSTQILEKILFDKFNFETLWLPADVSLAVVEILYESHGQEKQNKPSTSEVKKWNRLKEIRKICTNWLLWHIQEGRVEIKEHILSGLEASSPLTRRFSCYGIMYLLKLIKKFSVNNNESRLGSKNGSLSFANGVMTFVGKELDCLLYIAMEDVDGRVREEARRALKCLGHLGEERLKQMERNRMGFLDNGSLVQNKRNNKACGEQRKSPSSTSSSRCRIGGSVPDDLNRL